jgi:hypothetical protein
MDTPVFKGEIEEWHVHTFYLIYSNIVKYYRLTEYFLEAFHSCLLCLSTTCEIFMCTSSLGVWTLRHTQDIRGGSYMCIYVGLYKLTYKYLSKDSSVSTFWRWLSCRLHTTEIELPSSLPCPACIWVLASLISSRYLWLFPRIKAAGG